MGVTRLSVLRCSKKEPTFAGRFTMKKLSFLLLVLLLTLVAATPVQATPPVTGETDFYFDYLFLDCSDYGYDFEVWDYMTDHVRWSYHVDNDGNFIRMAEHKTGEDRLYNKNAPDHAVSGPWHWNCQVSPYTGPLCPTTEPLCTAEICTGVSLNIHLPGGGMIDHSTGQWYNVLFWPNGVFQPPWEYVFWSKVAGLDEYDGAALCSALAQ